MQREKIAALLQEHGIAYAAVLSQRGAIAPPSYEGAKGWEHDAWRVTFTHGADWQKGLERTFSLNFKTGTGHRRDRFPVMDPNPPRRGTLAWEERESRKQPVAPDAAAVLYSVVMDDTRGSSFADWCADFSYDTDSRRALDTYEACQVQTDAALRFFGRDLLAEIETILQDY